MAPPRHIPASLKVVGWLFILAGAASTIGMVASLARGRVHIDLTIIALFVGVGILRLNAAWRTVALVLLWLNLIGVPVASGAAVFAKGPFPFRIGTREIGRMPLAFVLVGCALFFLLVLWQYRVLMRPDIKRLFGIRQYPPGCCEGCG